MMKKLILFLLGLSLFAACMKQQEKNEKASPAYFDLKKYFEAEAVRLNKVGLKINKSVAINDDKTQKMVSIEDFNKEFESFISADINKASWRGSFVVKTTPELISYESNSDKIPVKKLELSRKNGKINAIHIFVANQNILYTSQDTLNYFPDSLYQIKKNQKIKLLEMKEYEVIGRFIKPTSN
ncbi:hypothetical protein D9M68_604280 [compost metagenome]